MPSLGPAEILVVLVVALLVFGPNKMPDIARQVGKGMREFKRVQQHLKSELRDVVSEFDAPSDAPTVDIDPVPMLPPKDDPVVPPPDPVVPPTDGRAPGQTPNGHIPVEPPATMTPLGASDGEPAAPKPATPDPGAPADPA
ncbi:MAG: sec-independent protein translocase protein TatB [Actinomycetota bacterium]|jgi:TatA/E family protein of Tat protein translocase|nr:sec-independent protein translocase protein TatB [Actinomycetota bacterium]